MDRRLNLPRGFAYVRCTPPLHLPASPLTSWCQLHVEGRRTESPRRDAQGADRRQGARGRVCGAAVTETVAAAQERYRASEQVIEY